METLDRKEGLVQAQVSNRQSSSCIIHGVWMSHMVYCHVSKLLLLTQWPRAWPKPEVLHNLGKPKHFKRQNTVACTPSFTLVMRLFLIDVAFWGSCHRRKDLPLCLSFREQRGPGCVGQCALWSPPCVCDSRHRRTWRRTGLWCAASPSCLRTSTPRTPWRLTAEPTSCCPRMAASRPPAGPVPDSVEKHILLCHTNQLHSESELSSPPSCRQ